ncbi:hypothetical protein HDU89_002670 [Geranomyces variabilis]|nr:hypothetical protein HDU89_002670 [Geranomyces variabilis]
MERNHSKDDNEYHEMATSAKHYDLEAQHEIEGQGEPPKQKTRTVTPAAAARLAGAMTNNAANGIGKSFKVAGSVVEDFKRFLNRGNVVDLAVGVIMGAAFTSIVTSIVTDIITPIISLGMQSNMENNYIVLRCQPNLPNATDYAIHKFVQDCHQERLANWNTVAEAQKAGALTFNWGKFLSTIINFLIVSAIIFFLVKIYTAARRPAPKPVTTKPCAFCFRDIPLKASRCPECTSQLHIEDTPVPESVAADSSNGFPFLKVLPNALPFVKGGKKGV